MTGAPSLGAAGAHRLRVDHPGHVEPATWWPSRRRRRRSGLRCGGCTRAAPCCRWPPSATWWSRRPASGRSSRTPTPASGCGTPISTSSPSAARSGSNDDAIAVVDSGGTVRLLDIRSGAQRWQRDVGAEVTTAPVARPARRGRLRRQRHGDRVRSRDRRPSSGSGSWTSTAPPWSATRVVTHTAATLTAVALATGRSRWLQPRHAGRSTPCRRSTAGSVLATQLSTTILDEDGTVRARRPPVRGGDRDLAAPGRVGHSATPR